MRNYVVWRVIGAVVAASGVAAIIAAFALPPNVSNDLRGALAVIGFGALIFGGVGALWAQTRMRVEEARARGGDVQAAEVVYGAWQIRTGRQDKRAIAVATALLAVLLAVVTLV